jgi:MSHA biogenesis protein MshQ
LGTFANGIGQINLSAPNQTGDVDVTLDLSATGANIPYLQHDWPQDGSDGNFDDNPVARGSFGIYHGNDKTIYTEEVLD